MRDSEPNQGDTPVFDSARDELRAAELELMLQRERVAELRRELPPGPLADDYLFVGPGGPVSLAQLFADPDKPLVLYHFMFGNDHDAPCPMCAMWADGWNGIAHHLDENINFALVTSAAIGATNALAVDRGWTALRWISASDNTFKVDHGGEDENGNLSPAISVWELDDGRPRLSYSGTAHISGEHWRGVDLLSPAWHLLDLTRDGRGDWMPRLH